MNLSKALEEYGGLAEEYTRRRLDMNLYGQEKSGKTYIALSAPGPIVYMDFDRRGDEALAYWRQFKDIHHLKFKLPKHKLIAVPETQGKGRVLDLALKSEIQKIRAKARQAFLIAVEHGARSIVVDTGDLWWEMERMAEFGKMDKVPSMLYPHLNLAFETILHTAKESPDHDINLIMTHRMKAVYIKNPDGAGQIKTSRFEPVGYSHMGNVMQVALECEFDAKTAAFSATVRMAGIVPWWMGERFEGTELSFPFIAACMTRIIPDDENFDDKAIRAEAELVLQEEWET